jgi:hypothetical protein
LPNAEQAAPRCRLRAGKGLRRLSRDTYTSLLDECNRFPKDVQTRFGSVIGRMLTLRASEVVVFVRERSRMCRGEHWCSPLNGREQPVTTAQLAKHFQITERTLANWRAAGRIP